jgi:putative holliday junction resolvase
VARIIGLDLGEKRTGVAVSDETCLISTAVGTIKGLNTKDMIKRIKEIVSSYNAQEVIIGLPLNMDGSCGREADKCLRFAKRLQGCLPCRVSTLDERLTTAQGEAILLLADMSRNKRKQNIDKLAAQIILQAYLDLKNAS